MPIDLEKLNRLHDVLIDPNRSKSWTESAWGLAIRQARSANLLATMASRFDQLPSLVAIPEQAKQHFLAANNVVYQRNASVLWECKQIRGALEPVGLQPIFLKGAAYVNAELPLGEHRNFADIDMIVPKERLAEAETQLLLSGWFSTTTDAYDQRYYRRWMHEIPPLRHIRRGTTLDLHHAISPPTAKYLAKTDLIFSQAIAAPGVGGTQVLNPPDMILHAATHLFLEGEADNALRNLVDLSELLVHFQKDPGFNNQLMDRAVQVGLMRPLFYAIRYLELVLHQSGIEKLKRNLASESPGRLSLAFLDFIYGNVFQGNHPSVLRPLHPLAKTLLYLRGHWLRMPAWLLLPHLIRKLVRSAIPEKQSISDQ
jgi:hypothetical protein